MIYQNVVNVSEVSALNHQRTGEQYATTIKHIQKNSQEKYHIEQSAVIFCNDLEDLEEFNRRVVLSNKYPKKLKFLVICEKSIDRKFPKPHKLSWDNGLILEFQYFLITKAGSIELVTYEWFNEDKCNQPQLTLLNSFSKTTLTWKNQLAIKDKFVNFNQCLITLQMVIPRLYEYCVKDDVPHSFVIDIFETLAYKGNFTTKVIDRGVERRTKISDIQLVITESSYVRSVMDNFHATTANTERIYGFIVTPSELYTSYEKLFMPFDEMIWILLIATFGFSFGFILVIKRYSPWFVQNWIFGEGVTTPAYNLLGIFFGISQVRVPIENSARFILISFLLFCLIVRTAYQGVFFEMFTHDLRRPQVQTIDDLYKQNFTIFAAPIAVKLLRLIEKSRRPKINASDVFFDKLIERTVAEKVAIFTYINVNEVNIEYFKAGYSSRDILKERLMTIPVGFRFPRNHFLYHITDEVVQNLISAGIIDQCKGFRRGICTVPYEEDEWEPYVFSLDDLQFGFIVWLVAVGVSLIVKVLMLTWFYGKRMVIRIVRTGTGLYFILKRLQRGFGV